MDDLKKNKIDTEVNKDDTIKPDEKKTIEKLRGAENFEPGKTHSGKNFFDKMKEMFS